MNQKQKEELNKELCQLLGICWHEHKCTKVDGGFSWVCGKCRDVYPFEDGSLLSNPDFTSDSGKIQLLREMRRRDDWVGFIEKVGMIHHPPHSQSRGRETIYYIEDFDILDRTGLLAIAAKDFLKGQKERS